MTAPTSVTLSFFTRKANTTPRQQSGTLDELTALFSDREWRTLKDGPMFSPARFAPGTTRKNENVVDVSLLVADIDGEYDYQALTERLAPFTWWLWSTHSYTPENGKIRVAILLSQPVPAATWRDFWQRAQDHLFHGVMDENCKAVSEAYYLPSAPRGSVVLAEHHEGRALDPDELPAATTKVASASSEPLPEALHDGERNHHLIRLVGSLRRSGLTTDEVLETLRTVNQTRCAPPLDDWRLQAMAASTTSWWEPPADDAPMDIEERYARVMQEVWRLKEERAAEDAIMADANQTPAQRIARMVKARILADRIERGDLETIITQEGEIIENVVPVPKKTIALRAGVSVRTVDAVDAQDRELGLVRSAVKDVFSPLAGATEPCHHLVTFTAPQTTVADLRRAYATMPKLETVKRLAPEPENIRGWEGQLDQCPAHPYAETEVRSFVTCSVDGRPLHQASPTNTQNLQIGSFYGGEQAPPLVTYSYTAKRADWSDDCELADYLMGCRLEAATVGCRESDNTMSLDMEIAPLNSAMDRIADWAAVHSWAPLPCANGRTIAGGESNWCQFFKWGRAEDVQLALDAIARSEVVAEAVS